jgi:O-antigen/teichoic acid export membrane protein
MGVVQGSNLKAKSARAAMKLGVGTLVGQCTKFVRRMILARILAPSELGVMAIVFSVSIALEALTEVGVKQSVIQNKKGANDDYLNMAWWMQLVRGLCLSGIAVTVAPWIGSFYHKPELVSLLRVSFLAIAFRAFISPRAYVLEKEYKFGTRVILFEGSALLGSILTIVLALLLKNVWALVLGFVGEAVALCLFSFVLVPFLPRFKIHRDSLGDLMKYARGIFGLPILTAISFQAPILILGKMIDDYQLGLFSYAYMLAYFPTDLYMRVIGPILLPAFSKKQDDSRSLCRGIIEVTRWTSITGLPLIAFMTCCASELLSVAYGPGYAVMAFPFAVLCLQIVTRNGAMILAGMYLAVGKPHLHRFYAAMRAIVITLIYPATLHWGVLGASFAIVLGSLVILSMQVIGCRRTIGLRFGEYIGAYASGLVACIPVVLVFDVLSQSRVDQPLLVLGIGAFVLALTLAGGALAVSHSGMPLIPRGGCRQAV